MLLAFCISADEMCPKIVSFSSLMDVLTLCLAVYGRLYFPLPPLGNLPLSLSQKLSPRGAS